MNMNALTELAAANAVLTPRYAKLAADFLQEAMRGTATEIVAVVQSLTAEVVANGVPGDEDSCVLAFAAAAVLEILESDVRRTSTEVLEAAVDILGDRYDATL